MSIQKELRDWANKVVTKYNRVAQTEDSSYYTQSNLSIINRKPQVLILGINPGSSGKYKIIDPETFLKGNPFFSPQVNWHIWNGLKKIFRAGGIEMLLENEEDFVFSNIYHFDTPKADQLLSKIKNDCEYIELTKELIQKLTPSMVICLGKDDCMKKLIKFPKILIDDEELLYGEIDNIPIYGIPHTSKYYTNEESTMLGVVLASLYKKEMLPEKSEISNRFKDVIKAFKDRKEQIKPDNILNSMIEDSFKRYVRKESWNKEKDWYEISSNFIVKVTSSGGGYISIRDSKFDKNNNYSKRIIDNQDAIIKYLEEKGYELKNDGAKNTSLGHKPFRKYEEWKQGPQYVVLSILKEIDELGPELEEIYNKKDV